MPVKLHREVSKIQKDELLQHKKFGKEYTKSHWQRPNCKCTKNVEKNQIEKWQQKWY